jgi:hypothetical protein
MQKYARVPIFPLAKFLSSKERQRLPAPMLPVSFMFGDDEITVDRVLVCDRGVARKAGGRGYRYECRVSWQHDDRIRSKESVVWFDDFLQEWFVEVPESQVPVGWDDARKLSDVGDFYDE